jgi:PAS domain S-box-containing protein
MASMCAGASYLAACQSAATAGDDLAAALAGIMAVLAGEQACFMLEYPCHGPGEERWFVMRVTPLEGQRGVVVAHDNITERKRVQEELDRFFNLSLDMHCVADFDGFFKRINSAFERTLGYTAAELHSKSFLSFVHPDDQAATIAVMERLADGADAIGFENRSRCRGGSYRWIIWNSTPMVGDRLIYAGAQHQRAQARRGGAAPADPIHPAAPGCRRGGQPGHLDRGRVADGDRSDLHLHRLAGRPCLSGPCGPAIYVALNRYLAPGRC